MSDAGSIGLCIHETAEILSEKYYTENDNNLLKTCFGFSLVLLKDLVDNIQNEENIKLYLEKGLIDIPFFKDENNNLEYIKNELKKGGE